MDEYYSAAAIVFTDEDDDNEDDEGLILSPEDLHDWYSEELLNMWMSIVEYHETWYLPLRRTFNQFCDFVLQHPELECDDDKEPPEEVQAILSHPLVRGRRLDWTYFFSLGYK